MNRVPLWFEVEGTDEWTLASNLRGDPLMFALFVQPRVQGCQTNR
jgi:hypothetical protein